MMSANALRWFTVLVLAAFVLGLLLFARGVAHHHGDDVGALGAPHVVARALVH